MAKFRKRPVIVDAVQFWYDGDHPRVLPDPRSPTGWAIHTVETTAIKHEVTPGDWIVTGLQGEVYPCRADIFAAAYEPVEAD